MIEFTDVVKCYEQGNRALNGVSMRIDDGEFCFLVGPSGSGKSTIIKLITGELKPTSGSVHVNSFFLERIRKREISQVCVSLAVRAKLLDGSASMTGVREMLSRNGISPEKKRHSTT